MRNLLFGVILGLLAVCQSLPVDNVTQIPTKPEDDFLKEVLEDGYLVDETTPRVLTTNPPRIHTTVQASQQPTPDSKITDIEGSAESNAELATTAVVKERDADVLNATQSENSTSAEEAGDSSSVPPRAPSTTRATPSLTNQTSDIEDASGDLSSGSGDIQSFVAIMREPTSADTKKPTASPFPVAEDLGKESEPGREPEKESESDKTADKESGKVSDTEVDKASDPTSQSDTETESNTRSGSKNSRMLGGSITEKATQQQGHVDKVVNEQAPKTDGHYRTPGWIIIVAFIVGVAALVMLCVAIATRDKWNGPHKASQLETKSSSPDQQREQEMTTFVHKESPRENGKAAEYTVIPLDELPENYSSH